MKCPICKSPSIVNETREIEQGTVIVRRRRCKAQGHRFSTRELLGQILVKKRRTNYSEPFDRKKVAAGFERALYKRRANDDEKEVAEEAAGEIEKELRTRLADRDSWEVESSEIGDLILEHLARLDWLAWVRFASVLHGDMKPDEMRRRISELKSGQNS